MSEKPNMTLPGTVEKIIKSLFPANPKKEIQLKQGAKVEVTVEAKPENTSATSDDRRS